MVHLGRTDSHHTAFRSMIEDLDALLAELNGPARDFFAGHNRVGDDIRVVLAKVEGAYVGCGGFRGHGAGAVEIKRMWVSPEYRGRGLGVAILGELEAWAEQLGYERAILETSKRLGTAVNLYTRSGYTVIPNYPPYEEVSDSVCMEKTLAATDP